MRSISVKQDGAALAIALVAVALLGAVAASLTSQLRYEFRLATVEGASEKALSAAEAGWNTGFAYARTDLPTGLTRIPASGWRQLSASAQGHSETVSKYKVEVVRSSSNSACYQITSEGSVDTGSRLVSKRVVAGWAKSDTYWKWCYDCAPADIGC